MRFTTHINNQKCLEWGLNVNQGALLDYLICEHNRLKNHLFEKRRAERKNIIECIQITAKGLAWSNKNESI